MLIEDERDLRAGLRALTAAAVPPADLAEGGIARARRRRRSWMTFTGAVVAGAAAAALLPFTLPAPRPVRPATRMAESLLTWPDLRDPAWFAAADVALAEYEKGQTRERPPDTAVRWLYAGLVPDTDEVAVAWAYCGPATCPRVVLMTTNRGDALRREEDPSFVHWGVVTGEIGAETPTAPLSTFLNGRDGAHGPTAVVFALTPPGTTAVHYDTPRGRRGSGGSGTLSAVAGGTFFAEDIGYVTRPTTLRVRGAVPYEGAVGVPGDQSERPRVGNAPRTEPIVVPEPYDQRSATESQLTDRFGTSTLTPAGTRVSVFARCEGDAPVRFVYRDKEYPLACDGAQRAVFLDQPVQGAFDITIEGDDRYTTFAYAEAYR